MLKISKNIKKIALSLLVVGLAIGTQAFKSVEPSGKRFVTIYLTGYDSGTGLYSYSTSGSPTGCQEDSVVPCTANNTAEYPITNPTGTIHEDDLFNDGNFTITSEKLAY